MSNSYFPEGEYRPQAVQASFNPIDIAKLSTQLENSAQIIGDQNEHDSSL